MYVVKSSSLFVCLFVCLFVVCLGVESLWRFQYTHDKTGLEQLITNSILALSCRTYSSVFGTHL